MLTQTVDLAQALSAARQPLGLAYPWAFTLGRLTLAGLHAGVFLVDHIDTAMAAHDAAIFVARLCRS